LTDESTTSMRITIRDVYEAQQDMMRSIASLTERLPAHVDKTDKAIERVESAQADHEKRLRAIETRMWIAVGALTLITVFMNTATKFLNL
jgi:hypothetical protein